MVEPWRSSSARCLALALTFASGCAVGDGMSGPGPWAQPGTGQEEEEDEDIDVDPKDSEGSTTDEVPGGSSMNPPPEGSSSGDDESGAPPIEEETTGGMWPPMPEGDGSSTSGEDDDDEPLPVPMGDPLWAPCNEDADCESGICFFVLNGETPLSAYCTHSCASPASDCPPPATGNATPECVQSDQGAFVCGLDCSYGQSCPFGMECIAITAVAANCF